MVQIKDLACCQPKILVGGRGEAGVSEIFTSIKKCSWIHPCVLNSIYKVYNFQLNYVQLN